MRIVDPGHTFLLASLDGDGEEQKLQFVKRCLPQEKYPGNFDAYPGTTNQEVCRVLISRLKYLDNQINWWGNGLCILMLRSILWLHEYRAMRRRGRSRLDFPPFSDIEECPTCWQCGHLYPRGKTGVGHPGYQCRYCIERQYLESEKNA